MLTICVVSQYIVDAMNTIPPGIGEGLDSVVPPFIINPICKFHSSKLN